MLSLKVAYEGRNMYEERYEKSNYCYLCSFLDEVLYGLPLYLDR